MIDLEKLLAPISPDQPTGLDLRSVPEDGSFGKIESLRREVDAAVDVAGGKTANWPAVAASCQNALATLSKDLRLAGWLTEALARTEGFDGLQEGLRCIHALLEKYWDGVHPQGEIDGDQVFMARRAAALNWLSAARGMLPSVRAVGLVGNAERRDQWMPWESLLEADRVDAAASSNRPRYDELIAAGACTRERWNSAAAATPVARLRADLESLRGCDADLVALDKLCEERFSKDDAPSFLELRTLLSDIREWVEKALPAEQTAGGSRSAGAAGLQSAGGSVPSGPLGGRAEALAHLSEVAQFFRQTEPHSPVSRLIERAVRWGNMSFEDLLKDVLKNDQALSQIWETLGVTPPGENKPTE